MLEANMFEVPRPGLTRYSLCVWNSQSTTTPGQLFAARKLYIRAMRTICTPAEIVRQKKHSHEARMGRVVHCPDVHTSLLAKTYLTSYTCQPHD